MLSRFWPFLLVFGFLSCASDEEASSVKNHQAGRFEECICKKDANLYLVSNLDREGKILRYYTSYEACLQGLNFSPPPECPHR